VQEITFESLDMTREFLEDLMDGRTIPSFLWFVNRQVREHFVSDGNVQGRSVPQLSLGQHTLVSVSNMLIGEEKHRCVCVFVEQGTVAWPNCATVQSDTHRLLGSRMCRAAESAQAARRLSRQVAALCGVPGAACGESFDDFLNELDESLEK
jgi:hypothetical protein